MRSKIKMHLGDAGISPYFILNLRQKCAIAPIGRFALVVSYLVMLYDSPRAQGWDLSKGHAAAEFTRSIHRRICVDGLGFQHRCAEEHLPRFGHHEGEYRLGHDAGRFGPGSPGARKQVAAPWRILAVALAAIMIAIGALTLGEDFFGWNLGIDQWLFRDASNSVNVSSPGPPVAEHGLLLHPDRHRPAGSLPVPAGKKPAAHGDGFGCGGDDHRSARPARLRFRCVPARSSLELRRHRPANIDRSFVAGLRIDLADARAEGRNGRWIA